MIWDVILDYLDYFIYIYIFMPLFFLKTLHLKSSGGIKFDQNRLCAYFLRLKLKAMIDRERLQRSHWVQ